MINEEDMRNLHKFMDRFLNHTAECRKCGKFFSKRVDKEGKWISSMCDCKVGLFYPNGVVVIKPKREYDRFKMRNFISKDMREKFRELGS